MKIAVVIPALDEAQDIQAAVASASTPMAEVVVVDGGSRDATVEVARAAGARVVCGDARGRAAQLRCGLQESSSDAVLFLHADSRLPPGWDHAVEKTLGEAGVAGGAFRLRFDGQGLGLRVLEWGVRLRVALFAMPYGDQAIFARRDVLVRIGGVPQVPFMEDLDLVSALKREGRMAVSALPVTTSARRYRQRGAVRTVVRHLLAASAWGLGFSRERIQAWVER